MVLDYLSGYHDTLAVFEYPKDLSKIKDSYVIINKAMILRLREASNKTQVPMEIEMPPKQWELVKQTGSPEEGIVVYLTP